MKASTRAALSCLLAGVLTAACALAQDAQKLAASSTLVFGATNDGKQFNFVSRAGGFFIDQRHVVSNLLDCCSKTDKGEQLTPIVFWGKDDAGVAKVIWSSDDTEIAILELEKPLNHPGVAIAPASMVKQGQAVYSVQYPKPGDNGAAQMVEGKLTGTATAGDKNVPLFKSNLTMSPNNSGGALFDACGNAVGINLTMKEGEQYAFTIDPLIDGLKAAGVQATVVNQPCSGGNTGASSAPPAGGDTTGGGGAKGGDSGKGGGDSGKGKDKGGEGESGSGWRLPHGEEWIPVVIVLGLLVLAFRPARKQVAAVVTGRHRVPEPAPYAGATPFPPQALPPPPMQPAPLQPPVGGALPYMPGPVFPGAPAPGFGAKPVLKGVAGQYAGSTFAIEESGTTLGRDPAVANLVFAGEAGSVSKRHCSIRWNPARGAFVVEDHGSTNGTFLATGERLAPHQPHELRPGERFYIGDLRNQFEVTLEP